jgi:hypothetical protein
MLRIVASSGFRVGSSENDGDLSLRSRLASRVTALISRQSLRGGIFFDQCMGAVNDVASAHSILDDTSEQPPNCIRIYRLGEQQAQSGCGVHDDSADRLVISAIDADSCSRIATRFADADTVGVP